MATNPSSAPAQRLRVGGPLRTLLVVDPAPLLLRMSEVTRRFPGIDLIGSFSSSVEAGDHILWDRVPWHLAYIDMALPDGGSKELVQRLLSTQQPGTIVGLVDHLWKEVRESCAAMGIRDIVEKGDLVSYQDNLERRLR
jgi:DNA-binding NarL/FixJ family response regulator